MDQKSDRVDSPFRAFVTPNDNSGVDEFDSAETSEVTGMFAVPIGENHAEWGIEDRSGNVLGGTDPAEQIDDDILEPGFLLRDRFEIVELVHSGGMGRVYKAIDKRRHENGSDQNYVAIKMMRRSLVPHIDARLALEREAAKTQRLSHPNIVNVYDFDEQDEQFYLVMEWLEGESVNALLRRTSGQRLAPQFAWQLIQGIAAGLQHAHSNNVVHADINPSNIFITETKDIKLLDFGVARYTNDPDRVVNGGPIWATRTYASPQVLSGATPEIGDDIFSLGCVGYRLLSGTHPFAGMSSFDAEKADVTVSPIPGLAEEQWQMLKRALSYSRFDRPSAASAFNVDPSTEVSPGLSDRLLRNQTGRWSAVAAVATIVLLGGFWWLSQSGVPDESSAIPETASSVAEPAAELAVSVGEPVTEITVNDELSRLDGLLEDAAEAIAEERFVTPADDNARDRYREVLALDATNPTAMSGLRTISDVYIQRANTALRAGAPTQAVSAISVAAETDPRNPAIAIVNELLVAQGSSQLVKARLAAAEGNTEQAAELLSDAARYAVVDEDAINAVRGQIAQSSAERRFLETLSIADAHIRAGRLLEPVNDNAYTLLSELQRDHQDDLRLLASLDRLGERLLASAAIATAAEQFNEATALLDAAEILGVLAPQVSNARLALQRAVEPPPAPAIVANEPQEQRLRSLAELNIEKYVAPRYPRRARQRGLVGFVDVTFKVNTDGSTEVESVRAEPGDVFASSAERAVRQWRFAPREDTVMTGVRLHFQLD